MATATQSSSCQKEAIARARAAFAKMPSDDALFRECLSNQETVHNVLEVLCQDGGVYRRKRSTRLLDRFRCCTAWMTNISDSVDTAVQSSAGIACPVWAPIKFVLKVSRDHISAGEQILNVIQVLSDNLPRLQLYERLHDDPQFQVGLVNVFADITEFAVYAHRFFSRRLPVRLGRLIGKSFKDEFGDIISRIEQRTKAIDATAGALSQEREAQFIKETQARQQQEFRIRSMQWLRPSDVSECLQRSLASKTDATCEWLLHHPVFRDWANPNSHAAGQRALIIHGPAGCGKSVLGSFMHNTSKREQDRQQTIALYFSFSAGDADRRTLNSMARTLLSQLLEHDDSNTMLPLLNSLMERGPIPTSEMFSALNEAIRVLSRPIKAIIDSVDECSDSKETISDHLLKRFHGQSSLALILLGQTHAFTKMFMTEPQVLTINITSELTAEDIQAVINSGIRQCPSLFTSTVRDTIFSTLLAKADGMFLWVKLMLGYLKAALCDDEILRRLAELPHGLEESYLLILNRLAARLDKHQQRLVQYLFSFTTTSGRPLKLKEVQYAYALAIKLESAVTQSDLQAFVLRLQSEDILDLCGGLLTFVSGSFHLIHNSARDYLTRPAQEWEHINDQRVRLFRVDPIQSHCLLSDICLRYLAEADYSQLQWEHVTSLDALESQQPMLHYACLYGAYHLNRSERPVSQIRGKILALLESEQFFFALEHLFLHGINDSSMHLQMELLILLESFLPEHSSIIEFAPSIRSRWDREYSDRITKFGETDPRTLRWEFCHDAISWFLSENATSSHPFPDQNDVVPVICGQSDISGNAQREPQMRGPRQLDLASSLPGEEPGGTSRHVSRSTKRVSDSGTKAAERAGERVKELLQYSNVLPLGHQFELVVKLFQHLSLPRGLVDPFQALWRLVKQKASSMPLLHLAAVTFFYHTLGRDQEAFEIGNICLRRMDNCDTNLKIVLRDLMGFVSSNLGQNAQAIEHFDYALPKMEKLLGPMRYILFDARIVMARCYLSCGGNEVALEILNNLIDDHHTYRKLEKKRRLWAYYWLGESLYLLYRYQEALSALKEYLNLYQEAFGKFTKIHIESILYSFRVIADSHFELSQHEEALRAIHQYQEISTRFGIFNEDYDVEMKRLRAIILNEDVGPLRKSKEAVTNALQVYIQSNCKEFGKQACNDARMFRYRNLSASSTRITPERAVIIYKEFLEVYEAVHAKEPHKESHGWCDPVLGFYDLARLHQNADQHDEAVELIHKSLSIYENEFPEESKHNRSILWIYLSDSELERGNHLLAVRAARKARQLFRESREYHDDDDDDDNAAARRLMRKISKGILKSSYALWDYGSRAALVSCKSCSDDENRNGNTVLEHQNQKKRPLSLLDRSRRATGIPHKAHDQRNLEALLLLQHQPYLDEVMRPGPEP